MNLWSESQTTYPCSNMSTVDASLEESTLMYSGPGRREIRARSVTFVVWVAEKSIVCRFSALSVLLTSSSAVQTYHWVGS